MTKEKGPLGKIISFGILVVTLTVSMVIFDVLGMYDIVIILMLAYFLFIHKIKKQIKGERESDEKRYDCGF